MEKKRFYFLIEAILQAILSIASIIGADATRKAVLDTLKYFPTSLHERILSVYSSNTIFIVPNIICIIISLIIFFIAFKNIWSKKGLLIGLSIVTIILSTNSYIGILAIANIIVAANIKYERKESKKIPSLNRIDVNFKCFIGAIICLAIYFSSSFIPKTSSHTVNLVIAVSFYLVVFASCIFVFRNNLKRDITAFKNNFSAYISYILPRIGIMYIIYTVSCFISVFVFKQGVSVNQQSIESMPFWISFILAVFWAPVVEEILFRGCIRRFISNDTLFIVISGIIFGFLHTMSEATLVEAITMMIPYAVIGCGFAYIYSKTNNITTNILCHFLHNTICMLFLMMI